MIGPLEERVGTTDLASDNEKASAKMDGRGFQPIGREWEQNFPINCMP
jgi:hypothetical protein